MMQQDQTEFILNEMDDLLLRRKSDGKEIEAFCSFAYINESNEYSYEVITFSSSKVVQTHKLKHGDGPFGLVSDEYEVLQITQK